LLRVLFLFPRGPRGGKVLNVQKQAANKKPFENQFGVLPLKKRGEGKEERRPSRACEKKGKSEAVCVFGEPVDSLGEEKEMERARKTYQEFEGKKKKRENRPQDPGPSPFVEGKKGEEKTKLSP